MSQFIRGTTIDVKAAGDLGGCGSDAYNVAAGGHL